MPMIAIARCLHFRRNDGDLAADESVEECRFSGVGRTGSVRRSRTAGRRVRCPFQVPLRSPPAFRAPSRPASITSAAACSAARFERPLPAAEGGSADAHLDGKERIVRRPRLLDNGVDRPIEPARLSILLERRLRVLRRPRHPLRHDVPKAMDKTRRGLKPAVDIKRTDHGLTSIRQDRRLAIAAGTALAFR